MTEIDDIPVAVKRTLVSQQITLWKNTRYDAQVRRRVFKAIGDTDQEAATIKDLERCEKALDALLKELDALPVEAPLQSAEIDIRL